MPTIEQEQELKQEQLTVTQEANLVKIVDQQTYDSATYLLLQRIIPFRTRWKAYWETLRVPAYASYKAIMDKFNEGDNPAETAERKVKAEIRRWDDEQSRIQQAEQRKAQEAAEREERERRIQSAVIATDSGATEQEVEAILEAPVAVVAAPVEPTYQKATGVSGRDNWKCKVTDMKALVKAVAAGKVPITYIQANESVLNARAKADRETLNIPGCLAYNERIISGRSR